MRLRRRGLKVLTFVLVSYASSACAPVFQDARLVGKGQAEFTPSFSPTFGTGGGSTEHLSNNFGVHGLFGITDRTNIGVGYGRVQPSGIAGGGVPGVNILAFGPKVGIVKDRAAFALPVSFAFGGGAPIGDTWEMHPTLVFTAPVSPHVDFNPSIGALIPFCDGCTASETLLRLNFGFGIRTGGTGAVAIVRPEFGFLVHPGDSGAIWTFGVGVSVRSKK